MIVFIKMRRRFYLRFKDLRCKILRRRDDSFLMPLNRRGSHKSRRWKKKVTSLQRKNKEKQLLFFSPDREYLSFDDKEINDSKEKA